MSNPISSYLRTHDFAVIKAAAGRDYQHTLSLTPTRRVVLRMLVAAAEEIEQLRGELAACQAAKARDDQEWARQLRETHNK